MNSLECQSLRNCIFKHVSIDSTSYLDEGLIRTDMMQELISASDQLCIFTCTNVHTGFRRLAPELA